jgi:hypothetical protein
MNKYKVFSVLALLLLITNMILVAAIFFDFPLRPNHKNGPRESIIQKLDFNDANRRIKRSYSSEKYLEEISQIKNCKEKARTFIFQ